MTFQVIVELTAQVTYRIKADNEKEARKLALEMADDGMRFSEMELIDRNVYDCADETSEE